MKQAENYVMLLQAANDPMQLMNVAKAASTTEVYYTDGKLAELYFPDGSKFWINYVNDEPIVGLFVEVGQVWKSCGGDLVTITHQTIDGAFYQFEGSNGISYSPKGFAFPDRSSNYDLCSLVSS